MISGSDDTEDMGSKLEDLIGEKPLFDNSDIENDNIGTDSPESEVN
jgi:hypothetical protein